MNKNRPSCYAPWITTYEWPDGNITPCCEWHSPLLTIKTDEHMSFEERFNHPITQKIKDKLLKSSKLPSGCKNCNALEQANQKSLRQQLEERVERTESNTDWKFDKDQFNLFHMDYRESNLCNFSCIMCGPELSSTHAKIDGVYGKTGILKNPQQLQMYLDKLDDVQIIHFLGGEPLLTDAMWTTLKEVKRRGIEGQMDVSIVTNGSLIHRNEDNLIELLEDFKVVDIAVSIDCIGDQHNYWRQKNTWAQIEANCEILYNWKQGKDNVTCAVRTAIGWPNAFAARDVFDRFKDMDVEMRWNLITQPIGLSLPMLPQEDLEKLVEHWKDYPDVAEVFANTISCPNMFHMVIEAIKLGRIQNTRDITFKQAFPEVVHVYDEINKNKNNSYFG